MIAAVVLVALVCGGTRFCAWLLLTRTPDPHGGPARSGPGRKPGPTTPTDNHILRSPL